MSSSAPDKSTACADRTTRSELLAPLDKADSCATCEERTNPEAQPYTRRLMGTQSTGALPTQLGSKVDESGAGRVS